MIDHIVVGGCVLVDASCATRARLGTLARDGMLLRAAEVAYVFRDALVGHVGVALGGHDW